MSTNLNKQKNSFGCKDYLRMLKKRGPCLPIKYFLECHLFDILNGTNTHIWNPKEKEDDTNWSSNREEGILYMCSWTQEVKHWIWRLKKKLKNEFYEFQFIDVGCGKGKPLIIYSGIVNKDHHKLTNNPIGIDYSNKNIIIANTNLCKFQDKFKKDVIPKFINDDALNIQQYINSKKLILYLYNPFKGKVLKQFIKLINIYDCIIIYTNPTNISVFVEANWSILEMKKSVYPNKTTAILSNIKRHRYIKIKP